MARRNQARRWKNTRRSLVAKVRFVLEGGIYIFAVL